MDDFSLAEEMKETGSFGQYVETNLASTQVIKNMGQYTSKHADGGVQHEKQLNRRNLFGGKV